MKTIKDYKGIFTALGIFIAAIFLYNMFFKPNEDAITTAIDGVSEGSAASQAIGSDILELSAKLQTVKLREDIFSSPLYRSLVDFSTPVQNQAVGRANPFDAIGRESGASTQTSLSSAN